MGTETDFVLLSLRRIWWEKMLLGEKTLELRKNRPLRIDPCQPFTVLVYITGGLGVCGGFSCAAVHIIQVLPDGQILTEMGEPELERRTCLSRHQILTYAGSGQKTILWAWEVSGLRAYPQPLPVRQFGLKRPPQSWQYCRGQIPPEQLTER